MLKAEWNLYLIFKPRSTLVRRKPRYQESKTTVLSRHDCRLLSRLGQPEATTKSLEAKARKIPWRLWCDLHRKQLCVWIDNWCNRQYMTTLQKKDNCQNTTVMQVLIPLLLPSSLGYFLRQKNQ